MGLPDDEALEGQDRQLNCKRTGDELAIQLAAEWVLSSQRDIPLLIMEPRRGQILALGEWGVGDMRVLSIFLDLFWLLSTKSQMSS